MRNPPDTQLLLSFILLSVIHPTTCSYYLLLILLCHSSSYLLLYVTPDDVLHLIMLPVTAECAIRVLYSYPGLPVLVKLSQYLLPENSLCVPLMPIHAQAENATSCNKQDFSLRWFTSPATLNNQFLTSQPSVSPELPTVKRVEYN